uniref:ATP synthase complex subunit 8 n=1 Tax=Ninox strenua TaxID=73883 RepID=A0A343AZE4_NINST|nr:ATP synthase F0 subunit 8 [Ninox strenua]APZ75571.1 ATP synthase F0 subunit 8 [Ninox strenua]
MPQLNPNPSLFTMLISSFTLSMIIQPKLLSFTSTNPPSHKPSTPVKIAPSTSPST